MRQKINLLCCSTACLSFLHLHKTDVRLRLGSPQLQDIISRTFIVTVASACFRAAAAAVCRSVLLFLYFSVIQHWREQRGVVEEERRGCAFVFGEHTVQSVVTCESGNREVTGGGVGWLGGC